jgi:MurNAc alpha-1-phosphate uridylyltransferase
MSDVKKAMVLAAGKGTRMRPLTDTMPKPLVKFMGRPLIAHVIERLEEAGIEEIIVNVHHFADQLEACLKQQRGSARIIVADERELLLDTGGGIKRALPLLGHDPIVTFNSDSVWVEGSDQNLRRLIESFDPRRHDALLMLAETAGTIGHVGRGDFMMDGQGHLARRGPDESVPLVFAGVQVIKPDLFRTGPEGPFSTNLIWDRLIKRGTLYGQTLQGTWMHVGTPQDLAAAEAFLQGR